MSLEIIRKTMENDILILDLLNMNYINKKESFIDNNGDGKVYFKINLDKLPSKKILNRIFETTVNNYGLQSSKPYENDEYFIVYDVYNKLGIGTKDINKGGITTFAVRHKGKLFPYGTELIGGTLMNMDYFKHPQLEQIRRNISEFADECFKWIKEQISDNLIQDVKGDYFADDIQANTYFQRRKIEQETYDYVIHEWDRRLQNKESITWIDFLNNGKIFIAL